MTPMSRIAKPDTVQQMLDAYYTPAPQPKPAKPQPVLTPLELMYAYYDAA